MMDRNKMDGAENCDYRAVIAPLVEVLFTVAAITVQVNREARFTAVPNT